MHALYICILQSFGNIFNVQLGAPPNQCETATLHYQISSNTDNWNTVSAARASALGPSRQHVYGACEHVIFITQEKQHA